MEPKFRLSPRIDALLSQHLEDRNRDRGERNSENAEKEKENQTKTGPPGLKNSAAKKVAFVESDSEKTKAVEKMKAAVLKGKGLPYVEVPPLRPALRTSKYDFIKEDQNTKIGPTYKSRAPVEIGLDIEGLVETVLDLEISIPLRNLAGVSNAVQKEIRKQVTKTKLPTGSEKQVNLLVEETEESLIKVETLPSEPYEAITESSDEIPEGHIVAADPVMQYLLENKDSNPNDLIVAKPSETLRAIYTFINRVGQEECLLDDGSMIVSMAKEVAVQLGLNWDPDIQINMESASNHVEKTLGLARNVCFSVGGLSFYLQVHVLENPPYRVLLGRPFSSLSSSTVITKPDGASEIHLTDPNTKKTAVVPTYERGIGPAVLQKQRYQAF
jgi:hypothetical protein